LALDEPKENDETFDGSGVTFLMEKALYERTKPITVDYVTTDAGGGGFMITSSLDSAKGCGSCSC
jgi:Fe-S cluster assembly iron-binding protein IscA